MSHANNHANDYSMPYFLAAVCPNLLLRALNLVYATRVIFNNLCLTYRNQREDPWADQTWAAGNVK